MSSLQQIGQWCGLRQVLDAQAAAGRVRFIESGPELPEQRLRLVRSGGAETDRRLENAARREREDETLRVFERDVEGAEDGAENGREVTA